MIIEDTFPHECPLGKYIVDRTGITGGYESDPVEACMGCNFTDFNNKHLHCACPSGMTISRHDKLLQDYIKTKNSGEATKREFQEFVRQYFS
jgi:hypothetical protein